VTSAVMQRSSKHHFPGSYTL